MKSLIDLKKKGFKIKANWQEISSKSIFFINTLNKKNFIMYQNKAIKKGCKHILCKDSNKSINQLSDINYHYFSNDDQLYKISKLFFNYQKLKLIFLTGTNGKTSVAYGTHQLLTLNNIKSSYIGTLGFYINSKKIKSLRNTTPSFFEILDLLCQIEINKVNLVFIEASSIGYCENRLGYLKYDFCFLTNLKSDHLDYHKNLKNYHNAKLDMIINHSKKKSKILIQDNSLMTKLKKINLKIQTQQDFIDKNKISISKDLQKNVKLSIKQNVYKIKTFHNFVIQNTISIIFLYMAISKKWPKKLTQKIFAKGRSEIVYKKKGSIIMVDYAHSADAFKNLLKDIPKFSNNIIVLYGCGGERDKFKRAIIAKTVSKYSNLQIITDDNPRNENPKLIRDTLSQNSKNPINIANREKAIKYGVNLIKKNKGILIVAGKGHENTQTIKNDNIKFSDQLIIKKYAKNF